MSMTPQVINYTASHTGALFHASPKEIKCIRGPVGCLPGFTEVMTPGGWCRIDKWTGQEILQWSSTTGYSFFKAPKKHIVGEEVQFLSFSIGQKRTMTVTRNHRVALFDWAGRFCVKSAEDLARRLSKHTLPTTWNGTGDKVHMSDNELRLWIAIAADGSYPRAGQQCEFGLRRKRKIERLEGLLCEMGIEYTKSMSLREGAEEYRLRFDRPSHPKHLDWRLAKASHDQAKIMVEEASHWDGLHESGYDRFDSCDKTDVDVFQYLCHCAGRNTFISKEVYEKDEWSDCWHVHTARIGSAKNKVCIRCDGTTVEKTFVSHQFCFETDSGFFVVRQNGFIFITGNSGKSVAMCFEIKRKSHYEMPACDGLRWSRWLVGRKTYDDLKKTTIATWLTWFPSPAQTKMHWSPPLEGRIEEPCMQNDGTTVRIDLLFYPLDAIGIIDSLKSLDLSGAWINEATQLDLKVVDAVWARLGRFNQAPNFTGPRLGMIMDTNSPDESNWWYEQEVVKKPHAIDFFVQPPALLKKVDKSTGAVWYENNDGRDPAFLPAENIENLSEGFEYYHKQTLLGDEEKIKRDVLNQYGSTMDGKPVYSEYNDQIHFTNQELRFEAGMPLLLGQDFGRTPATVIGQMTTTGQLRAIKEIVSDNMGICQFIEEKLRPWLVNKYSFPNVYITNWADPAGSNPDQISEVTCIMHMNRYGIRTVPSPVPQNAFTLRRDCVAELLRQRRDNQAGILIGPECPMLRKGFNGGYHYRRMKQKSTEEIYADLPEKNEFSHIHDAFQYLCYGALKSGVDFSSPLGSPAGIGGAFSRRPVSTGLELGGFGC